MTQSRHEETSVTKRQEREERDLAVASESARNLLDECREVTRNTKREDSKIPILLEQSKSCQSSDEST